MKRALTTLLLIAAIVAGGAWIYAQRGRISRQYICHRVAVAGSYPAAMREIAWFEEPAPDREARQRELVGAWGRGDPRFDYYLARYIRSPQCSESLREAFSLEFSWRPELLPRWAHYWSWQSAREPADELATVRGYLDTLASIEPPRLLTWRDILDLQALLEQTGQGALADRLKPDRWVDPYRRWLGTEMSWPVVLERPAQPFADWEGSPPPRPNKLKSETAEIDRAAQ